MVVGRLHVLSEPARWCERTHKHKHTKRLAPARNHECCPTLVWRKPTSSCEVLPRCAVARQSRSLRRCPVQIAILPSTGIWELQDLLCVDLLQLLRKLRRPPSKISHLFKGAVGKARGGLGVLAQCRERGMSEAPKLQNAPKWARVKWT